MITQRTHHLELIQFAVAHEWSRCELAQLGPDAIALRTRETARGLVMQLVVGIMGRKHKGTEIRYPATWWDAFKVRWFVGWFAWALRRWPAKWITLRPEMLELYPDVRPISGQRSMCLAEFVPLRESDRAL